MKRNIGLIGFFSAMVAIAILIVLGETTTVSFDEPPTWRFVAMLAAAFTGGIAAATGSLWWVWEARIAKRNAELAQEPPSGLDRSVSWMRQDEKGRLARRRAGINL